MKIGLVPRLQARQSRSACCLHQSFQIVCTPASTRTRRIRKVLLDKQGGAVVAAVTCLVRGERRGGEGGGGAVTVVRLGGRCSSKSSGIRSSNNTSDSLTPCAHFAFGTSVKARLLLMSRRIPPVPLWLWQPADTRLQEADLRAGIAAMLARHHELCRKPRGR